MKTVVPAHPPLPLTIAAGLVAIEGFFFIGYGILELFHTAESRLAVGLTTAVFFGLYGLGLVVCAWAVRRGDSWARSPIVLAQLIQLLVAWSFKSGETSGVAAALLAVAVAVLVGLLQPSSTKYLADDES